MCRAFPFSLGCGKSLFPSYYVIPAEAGIQFFQCILDSRFPESDGVLDFFRTPLEGFQDGIDEDQILPGMNG
jgi:hypothetical protein